MERPIPARDFRILLASVMAMALALAFGVSPTSQCEVDCLV